MMATTESRVTKIPKFFFYGYGDHRDLHSFPTRRSSDLPCRSIYRWTRATSTAIVTAVTSEAQALTRRFGTVHATALNMTNMMGIGPFITIPLLMSALGGPQAMLGWAVALIIVVCDGMVWSELGAALPGSGGSFGYLRYGYGAQTVGRLMAFLFVWQFVFSGPLEIASGYIGFAKYLGYIWKSINSWQMMLVIVAIGIVNIVLLYRRITSIATITVTLWVGT